MQVLLPRLDSTLSFVVVAIAILLPGSSEIEKYAGLTGVLLYVVAGFTLLLISRAYLIEAFVTRVTDRQALLAAIITLGTLGCLFAVVYPYANAGVVGGGSDSDDALNLAVRALLDGRNPYAIRTYLGAPATYLPGSLIIATPFVLLGNAAYQSLFWLGCLVVAVWLCLRDCRQAVLLLWLTLLCTQVLHGLLTGGELLASGIYTALFVLLALRWLCVERPGPRGSVAAVLLGIGVSSRLNYLLLMPAIFFTIYRAAGLSSAFRHASITAATIVATIGPFWLIDPETVLHATVTEQNFLAIKLTSVMPFAHLILPLASAIFAIVLPFRYLRRAKDHPRSSNLLLQCALIQAFPVILVVLLASIEAQRLTLRHGRYGLHFLFFGVLASWTGFAGVRRTEIASDAPAEAWSRT